MKNVFWQECNDCGEEFQIKYLEDGGYEYIGETCDCEGGFSPRYDSPSIHEWLIEKKRIKIK